MSSSKKKNKKTGTNQNQGKSKAVDPFGPWKPSWYVLWGFIAVLGELLLIFMIRNDIVNLNALQIIVFFVSIPFVAHLLVSGVRKFLYMSSPDKKTKNN